MTEAIDKNLELVECNRRLIDCNDSLRAEVDYVIADVVVLCEALKQYDDNYKTKSRVIKHRAKCDLDLPAYKEIINKYRNNDLEEAK